MIWGRKKEKELVTDDIETYFKRIAMMEARLTALELNQDSFRDKVLRKIQQPRAEPEELQKSRPGPGQKVRR